MISIANLKIEWIDCGAVSTMSFDDWLALRSESAEARAAELEQRVKALEAERDSAITDAVQDALNNIFNIAQEIANGKDGCGYCEDEAANKIVNIIDNRIAAIRDNNKVTK